MIYLPVPVRVTCCGLAGSESATRRVAVRVRRAVGRNVTLMVQLLPTPRLVPHVVVSLKSPAFVPVSEIVIPVNVVVPRFRTVTV
jgi:hypothetical protein